MNINGEVVQTFIERITKHMPHLTQFEFLVFNLDGIRNHHVQQIIKQILSNLPHLEILTLRFEHSYVTRECFKAFGYHTQRHFPKLKRLNLTFGKWRVEDTKLNFDLHFPNLESLNINLCNYSNINDQVLANFFSKTLSNLQFLQDLSLNLSELPKITDKGIQDLSSCIGQISTLKKLSIDFYNCAGIGDEGLKSFGKEIFHKNKNLQYFYAGFGRCKLLTDNGVVSFANELGENVKNFEHLYLNFSQSHVTDISLKAISEVISENLKSLKRLQLYFDVCDGITDQGLEFLVQGFEKTKKIWMSVRLNFERCPSISKKYVEEAKKRFRKLKKASAYAGIDLSWNP